MSQQKIKLSMLRRIIKKLIICTINVKSLLVYIRKSVKSLKCLFVNITSNVANKIYIKGEVYMTKKYTVEALIGDTQYLDTFLKIANDYEIYAEKIIRK